MSLEYQWDRDEKRFDEKEKHYWFPEENIQKTNKKILISFLNTIITFVIDNKIRTSLLL